jgi:tripartite ATP-independent transporter DctM subunit
MLLFIGSVFFFFLFIGVPIAFIMGLTTLFSFMLLDNPAIYMQIPQRLYNGMSNFVLIAIPFFVMAGEVMTRTGVTKALVQLSNCLVGHLRGGLAHVNIVASIFFAGITGSAVSDTAAIGSVLIPAMTEEGYDLDFSAAVTAASSVIGPIIPPSIPMVVYASIMDVSLAGLFLAGFVPGVLIGIALMIIVYFMAKKRNYPVHQKRASLPELLRAFRQSILGLILPVIILGGILSGVFTPTEAAVIAVAYGFVIGFFVLRTLTLKDIPQIFLKTILVAAPILFVIGTSIAFGYILAFEQIPQKIAQLFLSISRDVYITLLIFNILFFIAGMFMDLAVTVVILGPVLLPTAIELGIHPLHFAIIMCVNLIVGLATPPVGFILFVACSITGMSMERLCKAIWPFIAAEIVVVFVITYFPALPLFLPKLFGFYP